MTRQRGLALSEVGNKSKLSEIGCHLIGLPVGTTCGHGTESYRLCLSPKRSGWKRWLFNKTQSPIIHPIIKTDTTISSLSPHPSASMVPKIKGTRERFRQIQLPVSKGSAAHGTLNQDNRKSAERHSSVWKDVKRN